MMYIYKGKNKVERKRETERERDGGRPARLIGTGLKVVLSNLEGQKGNYDG